MLKFFRTIRKKLIDEDNVRKYLLYAIGEILLVVIGILIALQINNWNEDRKERTKEQSYLIELDRDFEQVFNRTNTGMDNYKENIDLMYRFRSVMKQLQSSDMSLSTVELDSLAQNLGSFFSGSVPPGASPSYSEMKSSGLVVILQNKELSLKLAQYDDYAQVVAEAFRTLRDQLQPALHHALKYSNPSVDLDASQDGIMTGNANIEEFLRDEETARAISAAISVNGNMYFLLERQAEIAKEILALIQLELNKKQK